MDKAKLGGIFSIISGAFGVLYLVAFLFLFFFFRAIINSELGIVSGSDLTDRQVLTLVGLIYGVIGLFYALLGTLAIISGVYALKKRYWGLALAGAIAGAITFLPCGVVAIVFISMGKSEFNTKPAPPVRTS